MIIAIKSTVIQQILCTQIHLSEFMHALLLKNLNFELKNIPYGPPKIYYRKSLGRSFITGS